MLKALLEKIRRKWHSDIFLKLDALSLKLDSSLVKCHNELSILCDLYGSDKGTAFGRTMFGTCAHSYTAVYEYLFSKIKDDVKLVFECGLGTNNTDIPCNMGKDGSPGASLRVWRDYFKNAVIVGADIDRDVLFTEERIITGYIDQTSPEAIKSFFASLEKEYQSNFDIMIDDGFHKFEAAVCLFENSFSKLKPKGMYIIEDMNLDTIPLFKKYFSEHPEKNAAVNYMLMPLRVQGRPDENNLIIIQKK